MGNLDAQALSAWCDAVMEVRISSYERTPSPRLRAAPDGERLPGAAASRRFTDRNVGYSERKAGWSGVIWTQLTLGSPLTNKWTVICAEGLRGLPRRHSDSVCHGALVRTEVRFPGGLLRAQSGTILTH